MSTLQNNIFPQLDVDNALLSEALLSRNSKAASDYFIKFLDYIDRAEVKAVNQAQYDFIKKFTDTFLDTIKSEWFEIPEEHKIQYISFAVTISNMVAITHHRSTDSALASVFRQKNNAAKILTLLSHRSNANIDLDAIFATYPFPASLWWGNIISYSWNSNSVTAFNNLKQWCRTKSLESHLQLYDARDNTTIKSVFDAYFQSTYIDEDCDRYVRKAFNQIIQRSSKPLLEAIGKDRKNNKYNFKKIAVISVNLYKGHAVHRAMSSYLKALQGHYHLTFIDLGETDYGNDYSLFDEVRKPNPEDSNNPEKLLKFILEGNYGVVFYPDIGMNISSIIFSNYRLAPIQITGSGHPVSTFGSEIDFFIGGNDVELEGKSADNYSEKLVLIPGIGMESVTPEYTLQGLKKQDSRVHILCNWGSNKIYYPHLMTVKKIVLETARPITLHFLGIHSRKLNLISFTQEIRELLQTPNCDVEVYPASSYKDYMAVIEKCDFGIDSYPFGGYNRIIDMLWCHKPVIALEGDKSYNCASSAILRQLRLEELVASNNEEYVNKTTKLIHDNNYLESLSDKIKKADLKGRVLNTGNEQFFKESIDYIVENYQKLKSDPEHVISI